MTALARITPATEQTPLPFATDVLEGLKASPKRIPAKYFYDDTGSRLFEQITALPEYYPTRTETGILTEHASAIAGLMPENGALIEFGSGSCRKVRLILRAGPSLAAYAPVDISTEFLHREAEHLRQEFPHLMVVPVDADFAKPFDLPPELAGLPRAGFFPGSTIGNFEPHQACAFLRQAGAILGPKALFVIGVDLVKDRAVLNAAYNDSQGVTAQFNLNLLARINRELGANFKLECFEHHAVWNREHSRIEMHLASIKRQKVRLCGETIDFRAGETIHTENSYKYTLDSFGALTRGCGWTPLAVWTDPQEYFAVQALTFQKPQPKPREHE